MRISKVTGGAVAALGALALVVAWAPALSGQQVVVQKREPVVIARTLASDVGGVRLGVSIRDLTPDDVTKLKLPGLSGVMVEDVEQDSAAAKGGVLKGDVATGFDGESVRSTAQFTRLVRESVAGRSVKMTVLREGKRVDLTVAPAEAETAMRWLEREGGPTELKRRLGDMEKELELKRGERLPRFEVRELPRFNFDVPGGRYQFFGEGGPEAFIVSAGKGRLGVTVQDLNPELAEFFGVKDGALVSSVTKDSPAAKAGVKAGDVITAIDGKAVTGADDVVEQVQKKAEGDLALSVMRDKKAVSLKATIEKPAAQQPKVIRRGVGA